MGAESVVGSKMGVWGGVGGAEVVVVVGHLGVPVVVSFKMRLKAPDWWALVIFWVVVGY